MAYKLFNSPKWAKSPEVFQKTLDFQNDVLYIEDAKTITEFSSEFREGFAGLSRKSFRKAGRYTGPTRAP